MSDEELSDSEFYYSEGQWNHKLLGLSLRFPHKDLNLI